jgi:hypothetical protein
LRITRAYGELTPQEQQGYRRSIEPVVDLSGDVTAFIVVIESRRAEEHAILTEEPSGVLNLGLEIATSLLGALGQIGIVRRCVG